MFYEECNYILRINRGDNFFKNNDIKISIDGKYRGFVKGSVRAPTYSSTNTTFNKDDENPYNSYYQDSTRPDKKIYFIKMQEPEKGIMIRTALLLTSQGFTARMWKLQKAAAAGSSDPAGRTGRPSGSWTVRGTSSSLPRSVFWREPDTVSDRISVGYGIGIRPGLSQTINCCL